MFSSIAFNYFDYFCFLVVGLSILFGFFKGFINTTLSLTRFIISLMVTFNFSYLIVPFIKKYITHQSISEYTAFIVLFMISMIILSIIKYYILSLFNSINGGLIDRLSGSIFGLARGVAIVCLIFLSTVSFTGGIEITNNSNKPSFEYKRNNTPKWIKNSYLEPELLDYTKYLVSILPSNFWKKVSDILVNENSSNSNSNETLENSNSKNENVGSMLSDIQKILHKTNKKEDIDLIDIISNLSSDDNDKQREKLEQFLEEYNKQAIKDVNFNDHKKIMQNITKIQMILQNNE